MLISFTLMKRFTLLIMLATLLSVTAFAQNGFSMLTLQQRQSQSAVIKGSDRKAQPVANTTRRSPSDGLVTPPETATVETWYTADGRFMLFGRYGFEDYTLNMPTINVAFDGADIYLQGLSIYFKEGWIKGTVSGTTATFDSGQIAGSDEYGANYICGSNDGETYSENFVFDFDSENGILKAVTPIILETGNTEEFSVCAFWQLPTFTKEQPKGPEMVVAPEGLETEEWAISAMTNFGDPVAGYVYIGFDGNDVYMKGLCTYLPESWIKGTLKDNTITFAGDQYFGPYDEPYTHYDFFIRKDDVIFTYDAAAGKMTAEGEIYIYTAGSNLKGDVYNDPVITKVTERAATPATPNISQIYQATFNPVVMFTVPTTDVDGNAMLSSKLSFQFFKDVEEEISLVTFDAADYDYLDETMTVFPYGFSDNLGNDSEFNPKYIHLKQKDYNTWNKLGLQTIYTGGGEENKSEIFWITIKNYEKATFDFNAMTGEPCSTNGTTDGDINADRVLKENGITLTVSPKTDEATVANRFWSTKNGPQLRVYSGTLTFEAPVGKVIKKMVFNNAKWDAGNSADSGEFDGSVWTGEAKKVVVTIAGNTQLNSIEVYPTDYVPTAVEAPEGLVTETYIFKASSLKPYYDPADVTLWVKAGFDGDDVYIQGLAADVNENAGELWVKATKNDAGQYVIPANQFMGKVEFWMSSNDYFFTAIDDGGNMVDAVLDYDAEKSEFTTAQSLVLNGLLTEVYAYETFNEVVITKFDEVAAVPAAPVINNVDFGEWSHGINCSIPTVGINGETLNPQKLFYTVWVEKDGEQAPYTFLADMYWAFDEDATEVPYSVNYSTWDNSHSIYFYDDASVFNNWTKVGIQSIYYGGGGCNKSNVVWAENPLVTGIGHVDTDLSNSKVSIYNVAGQRIDVPRKGLNIINGRKVVVK